MKLPNPFRKSKNLDESAKSGGDPKERKRLLDTIRLPLVSVFPRKRKVVVEEGLESQAGLASMETLGDNDKSADKGGEEMKQIPLDVSSIQFFYDFIVYNFSILFRNLELKLFFNYLKF